MMSISLSAIFIILAGAIHCAPPEIQCAAPIAPEHGEAFLYQEGHVVRYVCEPGYVFKGKEIVRCIEGKWEEPNPACLEIENEKKEDPDKIVFEPIFPPLPSWNSDNAQGVNEQETNTISGDIPLSDDASGGLLMPLRKGKNQLQDDKGKSKSSNDPSSKTVENGEDEEVINGTTSPVSGDDEGYQSDDAALRQLYWYAHYYHGAPGVMTLTPSQLAWINSLHPELRDEYLRDMYVMRVGGTTEPGRVQALVARDAYDYIYRAPYVRRPVSLVVEDPVATYDYSCSQSGYPFIKAPRLPNMQVERYDTRQNPYDTYRYYLSAIYRCNRGYEMQDTRYTELHCRKGDWVGVRPVCVRRA